MRTHFLIALTGAAISASAFAADIPLSVLNGGPSSDSIPSADSDPVAFIVAPREIVDPSIPTNLPIVDLNGNSLLVQDATNPTASGVRNRSRAAIAFWSLTTLTFNPAEIRIQANLDFDPTLADSYLLFLNADDAAAINTMGELDAFIAANTPNFDYVRVNLNTAGFSAGTGAGGNYNAADISAASLNTGALTVNMQDFTTSLALPGPGYPFDFEAGLIVFGAPGHTGVPTEYFGVRPDGGRQVKPLKAELLPSNDTIRIFADTQLVTDGGDSISLSDTPVTGLEGFAFRVRLNGTGVVNTLPTFLEHSLSVPSSVSSVEVTGPYSDTIKIVLETPIGQSDLELVLNSTIGFAGPNQNFDWVTSFAGEIPDAMSSTYAPINRPACPGAGIDADANDDLVIDFADLNAVLTQFGLVGPGLSGDVDDNGTVNFADLNAVLSAFGMSCE